MREKLFTAILLISLNCTFAQTSYEPAQSELEKNISKLFPLLSDIQKVSNKTNQDLWFAYIQESCQIESHINLRDFNVCMVANFSSRNQQIEKTYKQLKESKDQGKIIYYDNAVVENTFNEASLFDYSVLNVPCDNSSECIGKKVLKISDKKGTLLQYIELDTLFIPSNSGNDLSLFQTQSNGMFTSMPITLININFDEFDDLAILIGVDPLTQNPQYKVYLFDPESYQFMHNQALSDITQNGGDYRLDSQNQLLISRYKGSDNQAYEASFVIADRLLPSLKDIKKNDQ